METSRRERRIGYLIAAAVALAMTAWLAWVTIGVRNIAAGNPSPTERGQVDW